MHGLDGDSGLKLFVVVHSMDSRNLHDLGGSHGTMRRDDAVAHHPQDEKRQGDTNFLPSTNTSRRNRTSDTPDAARPSRYPTAIEDLAQGDSFEDGPLVSPDSLPTMASSWEEHSDEERSRRLSRGDRRKFAEATTPTLVDEEDYEDEEEQEMISLAEERPRLPERAFFGKDDSSLRRTPGAQMYKSSLDQQSMRRTPGANQMHRSANTATMKEEVAGTDSSGLGFGLTLSTPVAASDRGKAIGSVSTAWEEQSSRSLDSGVQQEQQKSQGGSQVARPPLAPTNASREQRGAFVAPWTLSRNPQLDQSRGVYSPNTLRLTEDLGNLLLEDDDAVEDSPRNVEQGVFRSEVGDLTSVEAAGDKQEGSESWTAPYVIGMDAPSRVPRVAIGRRRGKSESGRRVARGYDRPATARRVEEPGTAQTGGFLPHAQHPKPVRNLHPQSFGFGSQFTFGDPSRPFSGNYGADDDDGRASPRLLNFGGAFAPPAKGYPGNFRRPVPSSAGAEQSPGSFVQSIDPASQPFLGGPAFGAIGFQNPFQQQHQRLGSHPKFQPQFPSHEAIFGTNQGLAQIPTFNFPGPGVGQYPMHPGNVHAPPQDFIPSMQVHPHQQAQLPPFGSPQVWPHAAPMHYERTQMEQGGWHGAMSGWSMGDYGYGVHSGHGDARLAMTPPPPAWPVESELAPTEVSSNPFAMLPQAGIENSGLNLKVQTSQEI